MATLNDVAKEANVSVSTVSRVISGNKLISDATAERVRKAMEKVNYHPNAVAKSLANKMRTKIIGLVLPRDTYSVYHNQFFMDALSGITLCAQEKGYYIMNAYQGEENSHTNIREMLKSGWIDGAILTTVEYEDQNVKYLEKKKIPYAIIGSPIDGANAISVDNDNVQIMDDLCQMLIDKGAERIALVCGDTKYIYNKNRHDGYIRAMKRNGITLDREIIKVSRHGYKDGYDTMLELLDKNIDAVATTDDILAFGAVQCMLDNNVSKPISGFNNTMITEIISPRLTSVDIRADKLGYEACNLLIAHLEDSESKSIRTRKIDAEIIQRESTDF